MHLQFRLKEAYIGIFYSNYLDAKAMACRNGGMTEALHFSA